jgi:drug/metabolite transporter (DMT)-like permease
VSHPESRGVPAAPSGRLVGYAAVLAGAFLFGMWATVGTFALNSDPGLSPLTLAWFIQATTAVAFAPFLRRIRLAGRDWAYTFAGAVLGSVLAPSMYFVGLRLSTPVSAALLSNTEALFTVLFAYVFLRERLPPRGYLAAAAILGGAVIVTLDLGVVRGDVASTLLGNVLLVLAAMCWGGVNTVSRVVTARHDIPSYACMQLSLGSLLLAPIVLLAGARLAIPAASIPIAVFLALAGSATFTYLLFFAMRRIGALQVGAILATSAAFGVTIAVAFGFPLTALQALGGAVMALGVVGLYRSPSPKG